MTKREPLKPPQKEQKQASDPKSSVWVPANAGSGKTFVLALRVLRLLLRGTSPSALLCLTFTRAAAAEMQSRVFEKLADWATCSDAELKQDLQVLLEEEVIEDHLIFARRLFARAIETPGGLKIQTIHAFCERLLHQFPLEAGVPPGFSLMDDREATELLLEAKRKVLKSAQETPDGQAVLADIVAYSSEHGFNKALDTMIAKREALMALEAAHDGVESMLSTLHKVFDVEEGLSEEDLEDRFFGQSLIPQKEWADLAEVMRQGTAKENDKADALVAVLKRPRDEQKAFWQSLFFTQKKEPAATLLTKTPREKFPHWQEKMKKEQERLIEVLAFEKKWMLLKNTTSLLTLSEPIVSAYAAEKRARGKVDFNDLITQTASLLNTLLPSWVHYKLDGGIDHILVDEAQDTSADQWQIVSALASEFFAGEGARGRAMRSLFVVGDEKQSIFSFNGAEPALFDAQRSKFENLAKNAERPFANIPLNLSFRTVPEVLKIVDTVFEGEAKRGISSGGDAVTHSAHRAKDKGFVELWPLIKQEETQEKMPWEAPLNAVSASSHNALLAQKIASTIADWLAKGAKLPSVNRSLKAGDILILVRRRSRFFELVIKALKEAGVPVAGADRLKLSDHLAVMDLLAIAKVVLLPEDDLTLATVLKGPLFALEDEDLFKIGHGRRQSLWAALQKRKELAYKAAATRIMNWRQRADFISPYGFFAELMLAEGGRDTFLGRFGRDGEDPINAFLNLALDYSSREAATLEGFVSWFEATDQEIKRDMEHGEDAVRIMTVHGAKGLEAPVVFLADTTTLPSRSKKPEILSYQDPQKPFAPPFLLWRTGEGSSAETDTLDKAWLEEEYAEYHRLLYVAMTRARDGLIICGSLGKRPKDLPQGCWYDLVLPAMRALGAEEPETGHIRFGAPMEFDAAVSDNKIEHADLPDYLRHPAPEAPLTPRYLTPSSAWVEEAGEAMEASLPRKKPGLTSELAMLRGTLTHALFEFLPDVPQAERQAKGRVFLALRGKELPPETQEAMLQEVLSILQMPETAPLFAYEALREAPLIGQLKRQKPDGNFEEILVSGLIDRLVRTPEGWLILDYKTDAHVPQSLSEIAEPYLMQMALYQKLLKAMDHEGGAPQISAALLYTQGPRLYPLPDELLAATLAKQGITAL